MGLIDAAPSATDIRPALRPALRWETLPTVVRYGLAGGATQVIYLSTMFSALFVGVHYVAALLLAQVAAICFAFPVYRNRVFVAKGSLLRQLGTFLGVWWTGAAMSLLGVPALVEVAGLQPMTAQLLVLVVVVVASYLGHRTMTFRRPSRSPATDQVR